MPQTILDIILRTQKTGTGVSATSKELGELKQGLTGAVEQMTGLSMSSLGLAGAITGVVAGVKASVDEFSEYALNMDDVARTTGMTVEETSKLVQAADDARISFETIKTAAQFAAKHGISLTTESLANLSDEYLAILDPADRAKFAMDTFGKAAGPEMTKLLEKSGPVIRAMATDVENTGLVMTTEGVEAAKKYAKALDDIGDKAEGVKLKVGLWVVEGLNKAYDAADTLLNGTEKLNKILQDHSKQVAITATDYKSYALEMIRAGLASQGTMKSTEEIQKEFEAGGRSIEDAAVHLGYYSQAERDAFVATESQKEAVQRSKIALDEYKSSHDENIAARAAAAPIVAADTAAYWANQAAVAADKDASQALTISMGAVTSAMLFQIASEGLSTAGKYALAKSMGLVDQNSYDAAIAALALKDSFDKGYISAATFDSAMASLGQHIDGVHSKDVTITTTYKEIYIGNRHDYASGGSFTIPAGFPNDSYPLGGNHYGQSGETVTVTPRGGGGSSGGSGKGLFDGATIVLNNGMDLAEFKAMLAQVLG